MKTIIITIILGFTALCWGLSLSNAKLETEPVRLGDNHVAEGIYAYDKDGELKSPTFGVGIIWDRMNIDIAYYAGRDNPMQDSMRFSFAYNF